MKAVAQLSGVANFKAIATYNAAAAMFDAKALSFWDRHGRAAVRRARIKAGDRILDLGCGTGASALPAARLAGASGEVVGVDAAQNMLARAREKAAMQGLTNARFERANMARLDFPDAYFDRIISVFAIFFLEDMATHVKSMWRMLRPGGRIVITTWGPRAFQPCADIFANCAGRFNAGAAVPARPWERLNAKEKLQRLFVQADVGAPQIDAVSDRQQLDTPHDWWSIVMGSGYRSVVDQLPLADAVSLKDAVLNALEKRGIQYIETNVLHAVIEKPGG